MGLIIPPDVLIPADTADLRTHVDYMPGICQRVNSFLRTRDASAEVARIRSNRPTTNDIHTTLDLGIDHQVRDLIKFRFRHDSVFSEEGEPVEGISGWKWIIDPIDGTRNFVHNSGPWALSIGLEFNGVAAAGFVHDFKSGVSYWGSAMGAFSNRPNLQSPIRVYPLEQIEGSMIAFSGGVGKSRENEFLRNLYNAHGAYRLTGSSAFEMCGVASGEFTASVHFNLKEWDYAAARAVVIAAGGDVRVTDGLVQAGNSVLLDRLDELIPPAIGREVQTGGRTFDTPGLVPDPE